MLKGKETDWFDYAWHPITGCNGRCSFCYGRKIAKIKNKSYNPKFHEDRLKEIGTGNMAQKGYIVFVGDFGEVFDKDINDDQIRRMFFAMKERSKNYFFLLTRKPQRYKDFKFDIPANCCIGFSASNQAEFDSRNRYVKDLGFKTWACLEPLRSEIVLPPSTNLNWVLVGGEVHTNSPRKVNVAWVKTIHDHCKAKRTPLFVKSSVGFKQVQQRPVERLGQDDLFEDKK